MRFSGEFVVGGLPTGGCELPAPAGYTSMCLRSCSSVGQVDRIGLSGGRVTGHVMEQCRMWAWPICRGGRGTYSWRSGGGGA